MSSITNERLEELAFDLLPNTIVHPMQSMSEWCATLRDMQAALRELQLLRASAPVLSEEMREALEAGAMALYDDNCFIESRRGVARTVVERDLMVAQAALLRAMAERGK